MKAVGPMPQPVTLAAIKADPAFADFLLVGLCRSPDRAPGISAVSPPIRAQPAWRQPSAMPSTTTGADFGVELAGGEVVEEEQRLGALHHQVVDAHGDQVDADRVVKPVSMAILSLVPTPSLAATSTGSLKPAA